MFLWSLLALCTLSRLLLWRLFGCNGTVIPSARVCPSSFAVGSLTDLEVNALGDEGEWSDRLRAIADSGEF